MPDRRILVAGAGLRGSGYPTPATRCACCVTPNKSKWSNAAAGSLRAPSVENRQRPKEGRTSGPCWLLVATSSRLSACCGNIAVGIGLHPLSKHLSALADFVGTAALAPPLYQRHSHHPVGFALSRLAISVSPPAGLHACCCASKPVHCMQPTAGLWIPKPMPSTPIVCSYSTNASSPCPLHWTLPASPRPVSATVLLTTKSALLHRHLRALARYHRPLLRPLMPCAGETIWNSY